MEISTFHLNQELVYRINNGQSLNEGDAADVTQAGNELGLSTDSKIECIVKLIDFASQAVGTGRSTSA